MEELIAQLKRIADALEAGNDMQQANLELNGEWTIKNHTLAERSYTLSQKWIEWNKQRVINQEVWDGMAQAATIQELESGSTQPVGKITP